MERVMVSLGGSVLVPDEQDAVFLRQLAALVRQLSSEYSLILVCGGGRIARYYITQSRELGASRDQLDELGIEVTRLNARMLQLAVGSRASGGLPRTVEEAAKAVESGKVVVMGGTSPGHTTDAVSAMVAEAVGAKRIVNATSVDAAYTADPKAHRDAKRFATMTHQELYDLVNKGLHSAGPSDIFDRIGAEVAMRANIPLVIVQGRDLKELERAIRGEKVKGTLVVN
ncbi:MAG: UMP kinase [Methanomassiliicoccales archaeon]|jgi:uridylate kinase